MSYFKDPREMVVNTEEGITLEQDNRNEQMYHWGAMILDLCDMPVEEYMKPMTVICDSNSGSEKPDYTYTVKFVIDGEIIETQELHSGDPISFNINTEKEGRYFKGWYYGNTLYNEGDTMPSRTLTLTAKYECEVTFIYVIDGERIEVSKNIIPYKSKPSNIPSTNKPGYKFLGWEPSIASEVVKHTTFVGTFEPVVYTVTWSGYSEGIIVQEYHYGDVIIAPSTPEKEGYTFISWDKTIPEKVTSNIKFTAKFSINKYNINYYIKINNVLGEPISSFTQNYGTQIYIKPKPYQKGYTFTEWMGYETGMKVPAHDVDFVSERTTNSYVLSYHDNNKLIREEKYLYGDVIVPYNYVKEGWTVSEWKTIPETMPYNDLKVYCTSTINSYTVTFVDQNGVEYIVKDVVYGTPIKDIVPTITGKTFKVNEEFSDAVLGANDMIINGIVTPNNYPVTIIIDGELSDVKELPYGTNVREYVEINFPAEEGYTAIIKTNHEYVPADNTLVVNIIYLINKWILKYSTVGSNNDLLGEIEVEYNANVLSKLPYTKQEGYTFGGWYADGKEITKETTMPNKNLDVYGEYEINKYAVVINDGNNIVLNKTYNHGTKLNTVLNDNAVINYQDNLYNEGYETVIKYNGEIAQPDMMITMDMNLNIVRTPREFVLTFYNNNDVISKKNVLFGEIITYPTMNNYIDEEGNEFTFKWEDESYNGKPMPNFNLTIKGQYQEKMKAPIYYGSFKVAKADYDKNEVSKYYNETDIKNTDIYQPILIEECLNGGENITLTVPVDQEMLEISNNQGKRAAGKYQQLYYRPLTYLIPVEVNNDYSIEITDAVGVNIFKNTVTDNNIIIIDENEYVMYVHQTDYTTINSEVQKYEQKIELIKK